VCAQIARAHLPKIVSNRRPHHLQRVHGVESFETIFYEVWKRDVHHAGAARLASTNLKGIRLPHGLAKRSRIWWF
jgi:hypothetical protein